MSTYEQGFIDKCAEYNVNPVELVKYAKGGALIRHPMGAAIDDIMNQIFKTRLKRLAAVAGLTAAGTGAYHMLKGDGRKAVPLPHAPESKGLNLSSLALPALGLGTAGVAGAAIAGSRAKSKDKKNKAKK